MIFFYHYNKKLNPHNKEKKPKNHLYRERVKKRKLFKGDDSRLINREFHCFFPLICPYTPVIMAYQCQYLILTKTIFHFPNPSCF